MNDNDRRFLEQDLPEHITNTIHFWEEAQEYQRQLDRFHEENEPPDTPQRFQGLSELVSYQIELQRYQSALEGYEKRLAQAQQNVSSSAWPVIPSLVTGVPLIYDWTMYGSPYTGQRYELTLVSEGEHPHIKIRRLSEE